MKRRTVIVNRAGESRSAATADVIAIRSQRVVITDDPQGSGALSKP